MILFDTDTVTHLSYGNEGLAQKIATQTDDLAVTVVTYYEILRGRGDNLLKAADENELTKAVDRYRESMALLSDLEVIEFDRIAIQHFGRLRTQRNLRRVGRADLLIACIALANDALLVTRNAKDFEKVVGLRYENWVM